MSKSKEWSLARDLPDPIGIADLRRHPSETASLVSGEAEPAGLIHVPWPKITGERYLVVMDDLDELAMRSLTGYVAEAVDRHLPARPTVSSNRLRGFAPGWSYQHAKHAHQSHRSHLEDLVQSTDFGFLVLTDVQDCYGSISLENLLDRVDQIAGPHPAMIEMFRWLDALRSNFGLRGLPVGPDWSPTYAHALLSALDAALVWSAYRHGRWSDDVAAVGSPRDSPERLLDTIDLGLGSVDLVRSIGKTDVIDDPDDALDAVRDRELSALLGHLDVAAWLDPSEHIYDVFDASVEDPTRRGAVSRFRFAIRTLQNRQDSWAVERLVSEPSLFELDPSTCGSYVASIAETHPASVDPLFDLLAGIPGARSVGTQVHILRAASQRRWGTAESVAFEHASASDRPEVVRWWAAEAMAMTPALDLDRSIADVEAAQTGMARRRFALPIRRESGKNARGIAAAHLRRVDGRLLPTCTYLERLPAAV